MATEKIPTDNPFPNTLGELHTEHPQVKITAEEIIEYTIFDDNNSPIVTLRHGSVSGSSATFHGIYNQTAPSEPALENLIELIVNNDNIDSNLQ